MWKSTSKTRSYRSCLHRSWMPIIHSHICSIRNCMWSQVWSRMELPWLESYRFHSLCQTFYIFRAMISVIFVWKRWSWNIWMWCSTNTRYRTRIISAWQGMQMCRRTMRHWRSMMISACWCRKPFTSAAEWQWSAWRQRSRWIRNWKSISVTNLRSHRHRSTGPRCRWSWIIFFRLWIRFRHRWNVLWSTNRLLRSRPAIWRMEKWFRR